jgi:hypothetical protein
VLRFRAVAPGGGQLTITAGGTTWQVPLTAEGTPVEIPVDLDEADAAIALEVDAPTTVAPHEMRPDQRATLAELSLVDAGLAPPGDGRPGPP